MAWDRMVPFDADGNMMRYVEYTSTDPLPAPGERPGLYQPSQWRAACSFTATVQYVGYGRGRSALHITWKVLASADAPYLAGKTICTGMPVLDALLRAHTAHGGAGIWTVRLKFTKRGTSHMVALDTQE